MFAAPVAPALAQRAGRLRSVALDLGYALLAAAIFLVSASFIIKGTLTPLSTSISDGRDL